MIKATLQILFCVLLAFFVVACSPKREKVYETKTIEIVDSTTIDDVVFQLGELQFRDQKKLEVIIKNTTQTPVVINEVRQFCGCTIPDYSKEPIKPGDTGKIEVLFVADHSGIFSKALKVFINEQKEPFQLLFRGSVVSGDN